jgi:hypothetical protein
MAGIQGGQAGRAEEPSALIVLLDGMIERVQRSPLMRRAPAQSTPEEQMALAALLADLVALRAVRAALDDLQPLKFEMLHTHWPELGTLLAAARRTGTKARGRESLPVPSGTPSETTPAEAETETDTAPPATPPPDEQTPPQPDLAHPLLEALTLHGRALNTTQLLNWLHERGIQAGREQVMHTLFRHEELFRRRGASYWTIAGADMANAAE